jgi:hypothetical protein
MNKTILLYPQTKNGHGNLTVTFGIGKVMRNFIDFNEIIYI